MAWDRVLEAGEFREAPKSLGILDDKRIIQEYSKNKDGESLFSKVLEDIWPDVTWYDARDYALFKNEFLQLPLASQEQFVERVKVNPKDFISFTSNILTYPTTKEELSSILFKMNVPLEKQLDERMLVSFQSKILSKLDIKTISESKSEVAKKFIEILQNKDQNPKKITEEINSLLLSLDNPTTFAEFLKLIRDSDAAKWLSWADSVYETLKTFAKGTDLEQKFIAYEKLAPRNPSETLSPVDNTRIALATGGASYTQKWDIITVKWVNGEPTIRFDISTGKRELGKGGYFLETDGIPSSLFKEERIAYQKEKNVLDGKLWTLEKVKFFLSDNKEKFSQETALNDQMKSELKNVLWPILFEELLIDWAKTIGDVINNISTLQDETVKKLEEIRLVFQDGLVKAQKSELESRKAKEAIVRDTLNFLDTIWFNLLPKAVTDKVLLLVNDNRNTISIGWGVIPTEINIQKGILGKPNWMVLLQDDEKSYFIMLFNKMISGKEDGPLSWSWNNILLHKLPMDKTSLRLEIEKWMYEWNQYSETKIKRNLWIKSS